MVFAWMQTCVCKCVGCEQMAVFMRYDYYQPVFRKKYTYTSTFHIRNANEHQCYAKPIGYDGDDDDDDNTGNDCCAVALAVATIISIDAYMAYTYTYYTI